MAETLAGDARAFELLVTRYQGALFRIAFRMLGDYDEASDATQSAFISAYRKLASFDARFRFFSWLYRILLNECLNARRNRRPHEQVEPEMAVGGSPFDAVEAAERRRRVQQALLALSHEYREVIVLRHFADLTYDEIAATVGVPVKTVKSRLYTARQRLGELMLAEHVRT